MAGHEAVKARNSPSIARAYGRSMPSATGLKIEI